MNAIALLGNRLLIRELPQKGNVGGIILPPTNEQPLYGHVVATGPGVEKYGEFVKIKVKQGDTVLFWSDKVSVIYIQGEKFLLTIDDNVIGILSHDRPMESIHEHTRS